MEGGRKNDFQTKMVSTFCSFYGVVPETLPRHQLARELTQTENTSGDQNTFRSVQGVLK